MKTLVIKLIVFLIIAFIPVALFNINVIKPYGIFERNYNKYYISKNQHYVKMHYLLNNDNNYNCFVFGSSRADAINTYEIPKYKCYNMSYPAGVPALYLKDIKIFLAQKANIKKIVIALDEFTPFVDFKVHYRASLLKPFPGDMLERMKFYFHYLFLQVNPEKIDSIKRRGKLENLVKSNVYKGGNTLFNPYDLYIKLFPESHNKDKNFKVPAKLDFIGEYRQETLDEIKDIVDLCKEKNIELMIFFNPVHMTTYREADLEKLKVFKYSLAKIVDYWDFSGENVVTTNNIFYYETSHYRQIVGYMIISKIFDTKIPGIPIPEGFGRYVPQL